MLDVARWRANPVSRTLIFMDGFSFNSATQRYYARHRLSNSQFCMISFYRFEKNRSTEYHVGFAVANKKKNLNAWFDETKSNNIKLKMTGRCGIEALVWCRDRLLEFESYVYCKRCMDTKICVAASDSKRFRLYERALKRYGCQKVSMYGIWYMVKFIKREDSDD